MVGWQNKPIDVRQWSDGKTSQKVDRRDVNCNLVVLKMAWSQSSSKVQTHFKALPDEQFWSAV